MRELERQFDPKRKKKIKEKKNKMKLTLNIVKNKCLNKGQQRKEGEFIGEVFFNKPTFFLFIPLRRQMKGEKVKRRK